jgi:hypothetical protein
MPMKEMLQCHVDASIRLARAKASGIQCSQEDFVDIKKGAMTKASVKIVPNKKNNTV